MNSLASRMQSARDELGISQAELARRAKVSAGTIGNLEAGDRKQPRALLAIAKALEVQAEWLLTGKGPRKAGTGPASPPSPGPGFADRREVNPSDWALLQAVKVATTDEERSAILKRAVELRKQAREELDSLKK